MIDVKGLVDAEIDAAVLDDVAAISVGFEGWSRFLEQTGLRPEPGTNKVVYRDTVVYEGINP